MPKRKAPSRVRYEVEHPSLTVRVPAEMKTKIAQAAQAESLSVSEWVQAMAAAHTPDVTAAYEKGRIAGRREGEKAGYRQGRKDGENTAEWGGFVAGLLEAHFRDLKGQAIDPDGLARHLTQRPEQRAVAEAVLTERGYREQLGRLLRRSGGTSA